MWIANRDAGLLRISFDDAVEQFGWAALTRGFPNWVWRVASDPVQGGVWLAYHAGRVAYFRDREVKVSYSRAEGLGSGAVHDIRVSADGTVWVGTDGGLSRIRAGRVATLSTANGLPCNSVDSTIEDAGGGTWLYTPCGVVRVPPAEMRGWTNAIDRGDVAPQVRPIVLDSRDGAPRAVPSSLTMTPHMAIGADGKIWLAAQDGVAVVDSVQLPHNALPPPVHIEQLVADRRTYDVTSGVRLPPLVRDLQIDYTALSLVAPEKNNFRIMLEGRDAEWQDVGARRQAFYTDLRPGAYRFRVIASNNSGVWNEVGATLEFSIAPAYYQTRWFQALVVARPLDWCGWVIVPASARSHASTSDASTNASTSARALRGSCTIPCYRASMGCFCASRPCRICCRSAPRKRNSGSIRPSATPRRRSRKGAMPCREYGHPPSKRTISRWRSAPSEQKSRPRPAAPDRHSTLPSKASRESSIRLFVTRSTRLRRKPFGMPSGMRMPRQVEVEIRYDDEQFRLRVRDDGKGIDPAVLANQGLEGHYGLRGMPERAALIGGKLAVWSEAGAGTEVELRLPASIVYATAPRRTWWSRLLAPKAPANVRGDASEEASEAR